MDIPALSISVALCTHNGARFLREQVRSICTQSLRPAEIVLSDDASTDDSVRVVRAAMAEAQDECPGPVIGLRVFENRPALRVVKNFEQAVLACTGDLVALCDQDDIWHAGRLERLASEFAARPDLLLLHSDARLVDADGVALGGSLFHALEVKRFEVDWIHAGRGFDVFLRRNLVTGATTVFRRTLCEAAVPFPIEWVHDEWLAIIAAAIGRVDVVEETLIDYRQHASNQIGARRDTFAEKVRKALASRGQTHVQRAVKAQLLLDRLTRLSGRRRPVSPQTLEDVRSKLDHQHFRAQLPPARLARLVPVFREALTGRYTRFGRGVRGVVRDLFESV